MITKYSSIVGALVGELKEQTKVGIVAEIIIDKEKMSLFAIALAPPFAFFSKNKFVLGLDITHLLKNGVIINNIDSVVDEAESARLKSLIKEKSYGIGQKVRSETGENIGRVYDFLIETDDLSITKIYVKSLVRERIIPTDKIVNFERKVITIKSSRVSNKVKSTAIPETMTAS